MNSRLQGGSSRMRNPSYAIVKLPESANVVGFYQLLLEHGFAEVSFVNEVRENAFLPHSAPEIEPAEKALPPAKRNSSTFAQATNNSSYRDEAKSARNSSNTDAAPATRNNLPYDPRPAKITPLQEITRLAQNRSTSPSGNNSPYAATNANFVPRPTRGMRSGAAPATTNSNNNNAGTNTASNGSGDGSDNGMEEGVVYATCHLCHNRIMSSRLSNLTNHVRRHAAMKQYQCKHCTYSHNEMAKVRLHMHHNHSDFNSQPNDALCYEMQLQWGILMEQCFPEHANRFGPSATVLNQSRGDQQQKIVQEDGTYTCVECGEMVEGSKLVNHLECKHRSDCVPYSCSECDYQSSTQWKVRLHISVKHPERATEIPVKALAPGANYVLFLHRFFPEIPGEEDEEKMVNQLRQNSDKGFGNTDSEELEETTTCSMCDGLMSSNPISNLLSHAKRHYVVKQFRCPECTHACVDFRSMQIHISIKHPEAGAAEPIDLISEDLKVAWLDTSKKCFPRLQGRIEKHYLGEKESLERNSASPSPLSSSSTNLNGNDKPNRKDSMDRRESSSTPNTPPLFDVQFDEGGVISKIRSAKRPMARGEDDEIERSNGNGKKKSRSPSPIPKLRSSRLRSGDKQAAREDHNGGLRNARRK